MVQDAGDIDVRRVNIAYIKDESSWSTLYVILGNSSLSPGLPQNHRAPWCNAVLLSGSRSGQITLH